MRELLSNTIPHLTHLVITLQRLQKLQVIEELLGGAPVVIHLLQTTSRVLDLVRLDLLHDADGLHGQLDTIGRVLHGLDYGDVLGRICIW